MNQATFQGVTTLIFGRIDHKSLICQPLNTCAVARTLNPLKMKKLLLASLLIGTVSASAQKDVYLRIMHQWDGQSFAFNTVATTSEGDDVQLNRMEYYISGIKVYHDGGQEIDLPSQYILANAAFETQVSLGSLSLTTVDSIRFAVGVDQNANHADPSTYNASHPLAPKSPSMHWGWTAGYRFVAVEGVTGSNMNDPMEVHALGDVNYFTQTIETSGTEVFGALVLQIDADYIKAFDGISMNGGLINHGETGASVTLLENFRDDVFSESQQSVHPVSVEENSPASFQIQPNPANINNARIQFTQPTHGTVRVMDLTGRIVDHHELRGENQLSLNIKNAGVYLVEVRSQGASKALRLVVQE